MNDVAAATEAMRQSLAILSNPEGETDRKIVKIDGIERFLGKSISVPKLQTDLMVEFLAWPAKLYGRATMAHGATAPAHQGSTWGQQGVILG